MIIVTGGNSGLGKSITKDFRESGERVLTLSRTSSPNDKDHISCDITNYSSLKSVYIEIVNMNERVTALINCAGIASMNLALTTPPEITEKIIKTNLVGTIFANQIFAPLLIKNKGGRIINFSTIAVHIGLKGESVYVASKAGVEGFSRVFAKELSSFGITVNCIAPGPIRTPLLKGITDSQINEITKNQIIGRKMEVSDVVGLVRLIMNQNSKNITGQILHLGGV